MWNQASVPFPRMPQELPSQYRTHLLPHSSQLSHRKEQAYGSWDRVV